MGGFWLEMHCLQQCVDGCGLVGWVGFGGWVLVGNALFEPICWCLWFGWKGKVRWVGFGWKCIVCTNVLMAMVWLDG